MQQRDPGSGTALFHMVAELMPLERLHP